MDNIPWLDVWCSCTAPQHHLRFRDIDDPDDPWYLQEVEIQVHIVPTFGLLKRVWNAVRYVFGYRSKYGEYDDILLNLDTAKALRDWLDEWIARVEKIKDTED